MNVLFIRYGYQTGRTEKYLHHLARSKVVQRWRGESIENCIQLILSGT